MIIVIIAGGSGTRLWPLSTPAYPKHLLKINGDDRSLLQQTYERARRLSDKIYVVSEVGHIEHVKQQLGDLPNDAFIVEPARRGTANCILAALAHVAKNHDSDEPIASVHADHYIRDEAGFVQSFKVASDVSSQTARLVLVGVEPDYAATGFGYIEKGGVIDGQSFVFNVSSFKEKPDFETARRYLRSGKYLWNCGYFVGSIDTFLSCMKRDAPVLHQTYQKLAAATPENYEATYLSLANQAIDYALIEKVQDLLVVPAGFDWMDLGSFEDLSKAVSGDKSGNYCKGENIEIETVNNCFIHNDGQKPLAVIGLDNVVVVNTPSGTLIVRKDLSQKVGEISKRLTY
ncbi:MAG: mannose-1-phosphate guanylyltransferase [Candidatus Saccharimonadales bacterium]